jgi:hypothetical protein
MNFSKEYIKLCDDDRIQDLKKYLEWGDWIYYTEQKQKSIIIKSAELGLKYNELDLKYIWLPTGDQLDRHIKDNTSYWYCVEYKSKEYGNTDCNVYLYEDASQTKLYSFSHTNPLIAKIKLLIKLLEEEK